MRIIDTTAADLENMDHDLEKAVDLVMTAGVDIICYGCTTGSLRQGKGNDSALVERIERLSGVPGVATAGAVVELLREKGVSSVAVATPYIDELNQIEKCFLEANGFRIPAIRGLGVRPNLEIGRQQTNTVRRLAEDVMHEAPGADGLFISCTNLATWGILGGLARDFGRPVISSNMATLVAVLRKGGISDVSWGEKW